MSIGWSSARALLLGVLLASVHFVAWADAGECGSLEQGFGPYDYRRVNEPAIKEALRLIEEAHFTTQVERLVSGRSGFNTLGPDIDWTLRAFPNHHRALWAMARLSLREGREIVSGANYSTECYFDRAIRFQRNDPLPYAFYGLFLAKLRRADDAVRQFELSAERAQGDPNVHYNIGLGYLDVGKPDKAFEHAKLAYAAGFPLPGLRDRLRKAGAWRD